LREISPLLTLFAGFLKGCGGVGGVRCGFARLACKGRWIVKGGVLGEINSIFSQLTYPQNRLVKIPSSQVAYPQRYYRGWVTGYNTLVERPEVATIGYTSLEGTLKGSLTTGLPSENL
jgi:hypothetical protein